MHIWPRLGQGRGPLRAWKATPIMATVVPGWGLGAGAVERKGKSSLASPPGQGFLTAAPSILGKTRPLPGVRGPAEVGVA